MNNDYDIKNLEGGAVEVTPLQPQDVEAAERTLRQNESMLGVNKGIGSIQVGADGSMEVSEGHTTQVNSHKETDGLPVDQTCKSRFGRPVSLKDALSNPAETIVTVKGIETDLQSAINSGVVQVNGDSIVETQFTPDEASPPRADYLSTQAKQFINKAEQHGNFEGAFNGILAQVGKTDEDSAVQSAVTRFGSETGAPNYQAAKEAANDLLDDIVKSTETAIAGKFGAETADGAIKWMMNQMSTESRVNCVRAVVVGDPHAIDRIVEYYTLKNR